LGDKPGFQLDLTTFQEALPRISEQTLGDALIPQRYRDIGLLKISLLLPLITPTVCLSLYVPMSLNPDCTAAVHVIDFYLDDAREKEWAQILQLVKKTDPASVELLGMFVRKCVSFPLNVKLISELHRCFLQVR